MSFITELLNVSSSDGEESDQLISCFNRAVLGYAPFIFQLDSAASFEQYERVYRRFLRSFRKDPQLPDLFRSLYRKKDFDQVIEQSGSVEKRVAHITFQINSTGIFHVGYDAEKLETPMSLASLSQVIWIEYDSSSQKHTNRGFEDHKLPRTFEDLKELLNELMLVAKKQEHDEAPSIKNFIDMFENVERVGSALVNLYNTGCALFQKWKAVIRTAKVCETKTLPSLEVYFEPNKKISSVFDESNGNLELSLLCVAMETINKKWMNYLLDMRKTFHYLNYFNDRQLCLMSTGLAQTPANDLSLYYVRYLNKSAKKKDVQALKKEYTARLDHQSDRVPTDGAVNESSLLQESVATSSEAGRSKILEIMRNLSEQNSGNQILAKAALFATGMKSEDEAAEWICDRGHKIAETSLMHLVQQFESRLNGQTNRFGEVSKLLEVAFDEFISTAEENKYNPSNNKHVNLNCLGYILERCVDFDRKTASILTLDNPITQQTQQEKPKLMICKNRQQIIPHALKFFADKENQLPASDKVLTCHSGVCEREIEVFILRAMTNPHGKFYAIVFADELSLKCANELESMIFEAKHGIKSLNNLVIFCWNESSAIAVALEKFRRRMGEIEMEPMRQFIYSQMKTKQNTFGGYKALIVSSTQNSAGLYLFS